MKKETTNQLPLMIFQLICLVGALIGDVYILTLRDDNPLLNISICFIMLAIFGAIAYVFTGFRKEGAPHFKNFLLFFALSEFVAVIYAASLTGKDPASLAGVGARTAIFGLLIILAVAKDLGKKKSYIISLAALIIDVLMLIGSVMTSSNGIDTQGTIFTIYACSNTILSLVTVMSIASKYEDKAQRHSKEQK